MNRHALEQIGDQSGDGGIVLGGQFAGLAVEVEWDGDGDVLGFMHGRGETWGSPLSLWLKAGIFYARRSWVCGLGRRG